MIKKFFVLFLLLLSFASFAESVQESEDFKNGVIKAFYARAEEQGIPKHEIDRILKRKRDDYAVFLKSIEKNASLSSELNGMLNSLPNQAEKIMKIKSFEAYLVFLSAHLTNTYVKSAQIAGEGYAVRELLKWNGDSFPKSDYMQEWLGVWIPAEWINPFWEQVK